MPIFTRRRLQKMIDELRPFLDGDEASVISRLNDKKPENALGAEMELALTWAISKITDIEIEPDGLAGKKKPDIYSKSLFPNVESLIEITSVSDSEMSGETDMRKITAKLVHEANAIRKRIGKHLYFQFLEVSGYAEGEYFRSRTAPKDFKVTSSIQAQLKCWLKDDLIYTKQKLRLTENGLDVVVTWNEYKKLSQFNFFSSMPSICYSLEDNTLYKRLDDKRKQLRNAKEGLLKCIIVADVGSYLLRNIRELNNQDPHEYSGSEVIAHFLRKSNIDIVLAITPERDRAFSLLPSEINWFMWWTVDSALEITDCYWDKLRMALGELPKPRREGYQARSGHQQSMFSAENNKQYLGFKMRTPNKGIEMKISSRALQEYLAGRISHQQFKNAVGEDIPKIIERQLLSGKIIKSTSIENMGLDEDDDYITFQFGEDPAASNFK